MIRQCKFSWAWDNKPDKADPLMTRIRAAKLLKAWRRDQGIVCKVQRAGAIHAYSAGFKGSKRGPVALMVINYER